MSSYGTRNTETRSFHTVIIVMAAHLSDNSLSDLINRDGAYGELAKESWRSWKAAGDLIPSTVTLHSSVSDIVESLLHIRNKLPDHSPAFSRLDAVLIPLYKATTMARMSWDEWENCAGALTAPANIQDVAIDDLLCSVFCDPSVVREVADKMGFQYLEAFHEDTYPRTMRGIFHGYSHRLCVPVTVEPFSTANVMERQKRQKRHKIVMMYDTGSPMCFLTLEVLRALGFDPPSYEDIASMKASGNSAPKYFVRLNNMSTHVGICPKDRCEHISIIGQDFMFSEHLEASVNYGTMSVTISRAPMVHAQPY
jgi:hypothetical protein